MVTAIFRVRERNRYERLALGVDFRTSPMVRRYPVKFKTPLGRERFVPGRSPGQVEKVMDGAPLLVVNRGELVREAMEKERVVERDILHAARELQGIGTLDGVDYAILEQTGEITIIPSQKC
jgi:hypothetical protein